MTNETNTNDTCPVCEDESYPTGWIHCTIHLDPKSFVMYSDGDHRVRQLIEKKIRELQNKLADVTEWRDPPIEKPANPVPCQVLIDGQPQYGSTLGAYYHKLKWLPLPEVKEQERLAL